MGFKSFVFYGNEFVSKKISTILSKDIVSSEFHFIQEFLSISDVGFALTNPDEISARALLKIWRTEVYADGGANQAPSITFMHENELKVIIPRVVCEALGIHVHTAYNVSIPDDTIRTFFSQLGYLMI